MEMIWCLLAFTGGWLFAQLFKLLGAVVRREGRLKFREAVRDFTKSGGMPSGHAASYWALATYLGFWQGFDSGVFALALGVGAIIMYDACHVRYAVGELGKVVNDVAGKKMKVYEGHTVAQVLVGMVLGIVVGVGVLLSTK